MPAQIQKLIRSANRWRDRYNPLRGLTIGRAVHLLEAGERGELAELQWVYRSIEKRFATLRSLVKRRAAALKKLDWDIKVVSELPAGAAEAQAEEQRAFLRERYEAVNNLTEAIGFLALAEFRGLSIIQKHRGEANAALSTQAALNSPLPPVTELHWLPQWNFIRKGAFGPLYWNPEAHAIGAEALKDENRIGSDNLPPSEFLIREEPMPINEIALIAFVNCGMAKKDWAAFVEMFGIPGAVITLPPQIPQGQENEYKDAAQQVAEGASGALPHGSDAKFPGVNIRGNSPFKEFIDAEKEDVVLAGTGGKLTMLNEATGIGGGQADVHSDVFDDLAQGEAADISEIFQKQFDLPELEARFPGQPVLAYFELAAKDEEDVDALTDRVVKFHQAGFQTDPEEISEKSGLKLQAKPAPIAASPRDFSRAPSSMPLEPFPNRAPNLLAPAVAADLLPIRKRLDAILQISDPEILSQRLAGLLTELPQLTADINADPAAAQQLADEMRQAMARGFQRPEATQ